MGTFDIGLNALCAYGGQQTRDTVTGSGSNTRETKELYDTV